jgi:hypothetical protein
MTLFPELVRTWLRKSIAGFRSSCDQLCPHLAVSHLLVVVASWSPTGIDCARLVPVCHLVHSAQFGCIFASGRQYHSILPADVQQCGTGAENLTRYATGVAGWTMELLPCHLCICGHEENATCSCGSGKRVEWFAMHSSQIVMLRSSR